MWAPRLAPLHSPTCEMCHAAMQKFAQASGYAFPGLRGAFWGECALMRAHDHQRQQRSTHCGSQQHGRGHHHHHQANISPAWISAVCLGGFLNVGARMGTTNNKQPACHWALGQNSRAVGARGGSGSACAGRAMGRSVKLGRSVWAVYLAQGEWAAGLARSIGAVSIILGSSINGFSSINRFSSIDRFGSVQFDSIGFAWAVRCGGV